MENKKSGKNLFERIRNNMEKSTFCYSGREGFVPKEQCQCHCNGMIKDTCQGKLDKDRYHQRRKELEKDSTLNSLDMMMKVLDKEFEGSEWYKNNVWGAFGDWSPKR